MAIQQKDYSHETTLKKNKKTLQQIARQLDAYNKNDDYRYILPINNRQYELDSTSTWYRSLQNIKLQSKQWLNNANLVSDSCFNAAEVNYLYAQSSFYLKEYEESLSAFSTICKQYENSDKAVFAACGLMASHFALKNYTEAVYLLDSLKNKFDTISYWKTSLLYHSIAADICIESEKWADALFHLQHLYNSPTNLPFRTRIMFISGQVNETMRKYAPAVDNYKYVTRKKALVPIEMYGYSVVHVSTCKKTIENLYQDSILMEEYRRNNPSATIFEPSIVESEIERLDFENDYPYYFNDAASVFFLQSSSTEVDDNSYLDDIYESEYSTAFLDSIFENWDSISIHIPKTDFSQMKDTLYLPLVDSSYQLPPLKGIVSKFGWRRRRYHYGVDLKNMMYDSIYCLFDGVVRIATKNKSYGNVIIVRHYNGMETFYAHCSKLLVKPNEKVNAGDLIGLVGSTGRSTGPHLHLETRYKGVPINPELIIDFENHKLHSDTLLICKNTFSLKRTGSSSVSSSNTKPEVVSANGAVYYKVRLGDTLSSIAQRNRTSVSNIKRLNGLKSDFIREGQQLRIR